MNIFRNIRLKLLPGVNQGELAKKSGIGASLISHYETGRREPHYEQLVRLRAYFKENIPGWSDSMLFDPISNDNTKSGGSE